jgi:hypothetical protein
MNRLRIFAALALLLAAGAAPTAVEAMSTRPSEIGEASITDRTGETWDLSQAVTEGFDPEKFRHGLGRDAFKPLDESRVSKRTADVPEGLRVIGLEIEGHAVAASVPLLTRHETANITVGGRPVTVAY